MVEIDWAVIEAQSKRYSGVRVVEETCDQELEALLQRLDITDADAAKILGVHRTTVYRWVMGHARVPKMAFMILQAKLNHSS